MLPCHFEMQMATFDIPTGLKNVQYVCAGMIKDGCGTKVLKELTKAQISSENTRKSETMGGVAASAVDGGQKQRLFQKCLSNKSASSYAPQAYKLVLVF